MIGSFGYSLEHQGKNYTHLFCKSALFALSVLSSGMGCISVWRCLTMMSEFLAFSQDGNIPSGEAFVRQFLYGQMFFKEEFDEICDVVSRTCFIH